jgi:hypothetical protein
VTVPLEQSQENLPSPPTAHLCSGGCQIFSSLPLKGCGPNGELPGRHPANQNGRDLSLNDDVMKKLLKTKGLTKMLIEDTYSLNTPIQNIIVSWGARGGASNSHKAYGG